MDFKVAVTGLRRAMRSKANGEGRRRFSELMIEYIKRLIQKKSKSHESY